ncbi:MAG: hypothetical protein U5J99_02795 [Parvularculaceae bacterium]|nr:hypothetical protein [Parvularculaceae bacterium]
MDIPAAVEQKRPIKETPLERLKRLAREFLEALTRVVLLSALFFPILVFAFLSVDLPFRGFDHLFMRAVSKPGNWLSLGFLAMALAPFLVILISRRFGGEEASRVVTASWTVAAIAAFAGVSYLSPVLESGDMPKVSFVVAFVGSSILAQFSAAALYDITRGSERWWRAPFLAALAAFVAQALVYFPIVYWGSNAPWLNWFVQYIALAALGTVLFLGAYRVLMRPLRPRGGFGG